MRHLRAFGWACVLLALGAVLVAGLQGLNKGLDPKRYFDKNCGGDVTWSECADALTRSSFYLDHRLELFGAAALLVVGVVVLLGTARRRPAADRTPGDRTSAA